MSPIVWSDLPGEVKAATFLAAGLVIAGIMLAIPMKTLQKVGKIPEFSPNALTIERLPVCWIGILIYFKADAFTGFCITVFGYMLDRMDGKVAAALDKLNDPAFPGTTKIGKWLDPFIDKLIFPLQLMIFSWIGILSWPLMNTMLILEASGTLIREPFLNYQPFSNLKRYIRKNSSTAAGKGKVVAQYFCLLTCIPLHQHWMSYSARIPNGLLLVADIMAVLSIASRLRINKKLESAVDSMTAGFQHKE